MGTHVLGWMLIALGMCCILVAMAIAVRQFVLSPETRAKTQALDFPLAELVAGLIKAFLSAPPALAFLLAGGILIFCGNRLRNDEPMLPSFKNEKPTTSIGPRAELPPG